MYCTSISFKKSKSIRSLHKPAKERPSMHTLNYNLVLNDPSPNRTLTLDVPLFSPLFCFIWFSSIKVLDSTQESKSTSAYCLSIPLRLINYSLIEVIKSHIIKLINLKSIRILIILNGWDKKGSETVLRSLYCTSDGQIPNDHK